MPVHMEVTRHTGMGAPIVSELVAKAPTKKEFKRVLGPLSLMINDKMLRSFGMNEPIELRDKQGRLYMTVKITSFGFDE